MVRARLNEAKALLAELVSKDARDGARLPVMAQS
jgi:hypothetical protein